MQRVEPADSEDEVGAALGDLTEQLAAERERGERDAAEREARARRETREEVIASMRDAIVQAQTEERKRAEAEIQAIVSGL